MTTKRMIPEVEGVRLIDSLDDVPTEVSRLRGAGVDVGYDLETSGVDPLHSRIVTVALKPKGKKTTVIDVRHFSQDNLRLLGTMLEPLFDGTVALTGHNLKFDLEFALAQLGLAGHRAYDTMLAEQVILGLGVSSAEEKGIHFDLASLGNRYGVPVHKEERSWFIDLDERPEWDEPFPPEQVSYMRQDVSVVHRIKEAQEEVIRRDGLDEVIALEMRAVFALVGIEYWGVQIDRKGWLSVIDRVTAHMKELERLLHLGNEQYDGLDIHILKVRNERYQDKWHPYEDWMLARDAFIATCKHNWESGIVPEVFGWKNWSEYKKDALEHWYEKNGHPGRPAPIKSGVNLGSWKQVLDGFNDLFAEPQYWRAAPLDRRIHEPIVLKSVKKEALEPYRSVHPLVGVYLDYTEARKLVTVYGRERGKKKHSFIELLDESDRLRASYQQVGADTGRMSSYNPNFQQIPKDGLGAELRRYVVAAPGRVLVVADFSNIELRVIAELSGDPFLLGAFESGMDVHAYTAAVMWGLKIPEGEDPKGWTETHDAVVAGRTLTNTSYRKVAKTINYALLYGAGVRRLAGLLGVSESDAKALRAIYYATFSVAIKWLDEQKAALDQARKAGKNRVFARTRSGRRRWFDIPPHPLNPAAKGERLTVDVAQQFEDAVDEWRGLMASIRRQLANTQIQGLSADVTKEAVAQWYEDVGYDDNMRLIAVVHDEMLVEAKDEFIYGVEEPVGSEDMTYAQYAAISLERAMYTAMRKYLHTVNVGEVHAVQTPYWSH